MSLAGFVDGQSPAQAARQPTACQAPTVDVLAGVVEAFTDRALAPCRVAVGTVSDIHYRSAGDLTFRLTLREEFESLLNRGNRLKLGGALHVEFIARDGGHLPAPKAGDRLRLEGAWVEDTNQHWYELHPVFAERINGGPTYRSGPQFGGDPTSANNGNGPELCRDQEGQLCQGYTGALGQCLKVAARTGVYEDSGCTDPDGGGHYEWYPAIGGPRPIASRRFTTNIAKRTRAQLESVGGKELDCSGERGAGEYTGRRGIGYLHLTFTGCEMAGRSCQSSGKPAGEIVTHELFGGTGVILTSQEGPTKNKLGADLKAAAGRPFAEFTCGLLTVVLRGSVTGLLAVNKMLANETLTFSASKGRQSETQFEGGTQAILEASLAGAPYEPSGLSLTTVLHNAVPIELNSTI